jgi:N utilization substance protein B
MYSDEYELLIANALDNWELERIASMDKLLIKMALCELQHFSNIPVKVSMNEYIEISKFFSTPKSSQFINGILDKLLENMKAANKIKKRGKGLME